MTPRLFGPPPQRGDLADRSHRVRIILLVGIPFLFFDVVLLATGAVPYRRLPLLLIGTIIGVIVLSNALVFVLDRVARGFMHTLLSAGGESHTHEYSEQDALVISGRITDAIASYHRHIANTPADLDARLRLAALLATDGNDAIAAEAMYLEARVLGPSRRQDVTLSNGLIDLFRAQGAREQLKAELARFARRHEGSVEGNKAREYLRQMAQEERDSAD